MVLWAVMELMGALEVMEAMPVSVPMEGLLAGRVAMVATHSCNIRDTRRRFAAWPRTASCLDYLRAT